MDMEIGTEVTRAMVLKYRQKLKTALVKHEVLVGGCGHVPLLVKLCNIVEAETDKHGDYLA